MKKQLTILLSTLIFTFSMAESSKDDSISRMIYEEQVALFTTLSDEILIKENNKICDAKDQSSQEKLIKTNVACESVGRFVDSMAFLFLMTDKFDYLVKPELQVDFIKSIKELRVMSHDYAQLQEESFRVNLQYFQLKKILKDKEVLGQAITNEEQELLKQLTEKKAELYEKVILPTSYEPLSNIIVDADALTILEDGESPLVKEIKMAMVKVSSMVSKESGEVLIVEIDGQFYFGFPAVPSVK